MSTIKVDTVRPVTADASLTLQGDNSGTGVSGITIDSSGNTALGGVLKLKSSGNSITASDGTTAVLSESGGTVTLTADEANVGSNALVVDSNGNVGMGTNSPESSFPLTVYGTNGGLAFQTSASTSVLAQNSSNLYLDITKAGTAGDFIVRNGVGVTERMRIDSSGNLLVGRTSSGIADSDSGVWVAQDGYFAINTSSSVSDTINYYNHTAGAYRFYVSNGGTIYATNTTVSAISDQRLKENIRDLDYGLDAVMQLKPRKFDWKEGKGKDKKDDRGFIAQEFEQVFPDLIDEWKDPPPEGEEPYKSVRQDIIPVLVKAIQEQQTLIESQQSQIDALTARIEALETT